MLPLLSFADSVGLPVFVFFYFVVCIVLVVLILMHSGRDTGMAGMGYVPASQGGTHIVERNLTRLTCAVAIAFAVCTVALFHLLG